MLTLTLFFVSCLAAFVVLGTVARKQRQKSAGAMSSYLEQTSAQPVLEEIPFRYNWLSGFKSSDTDSCDVYIAGEYILIAPDENFPVWGSPPPILLTADVAKLQAEFPYLKAVRATRVLLNYYSNEVKIEYRYRYIYYTIHLYQVPLQYFQAFEWLEQDIMQN